MNLIYPHWHFSTFFSRFALFQQTMYFLWCITSTGVNKNVRKPTVNDLLQSSVSIILKKWNGECSLKRKNLSYGNSFWGCIKEFSAVSRISSRFWKHKIFRDDDYLTIFIYFYVKLENHFFLNVILFANERYKSLHNYFHRYWMPSKYLDVFTWILIKRLTLKSEFSICS